MTDPKKPDFQYPICPPGVFSRVSRADGSQDYMLEILYMRTVGNTDHPEKSIEGLGPTFDPKEVHKKVCDFYKRLIR